MHCSCRPHPARLPYLDLSHLNPHPSPRLTPPLRQFPRLSQAPQPYLGHCLNQFAIPVNMLFSTLSTALLLAGSANAVPWPAQQAATYTPARDLSRLAPLFPQSALPAPNEELKYVLLGIGTQNYTCTTGDENAAPGTTGALGQSLFYPGLRSLLTFIQPHSTTSALPSTTTRLPSGRFPTSLASPSP